MLQILGESSGGEEFYTPAASIHKVSRFVVFPDRTQSRSRARSLQRFLLHMDTYLIFRTIQDLPQALEHPIPWRSHHQDWTVSQHTLTQRALPHHDLPRRAQLHRYLSHSILCHPRRRVSLFSGAAAQSCPHSPAPGSNPPPAKENSGKPSLRATCACEKKGVGHCSWIISLFPGARDPM